MSSTAIEQVKRHQITKERLLDVLRNRISVVNLGNEGVQFKGSPSHPTTYITAQRSSDQTQWIITNIQIVDQQASRLEPSSLKPSNQRKEIITSNQEDRSLPVLAFTKHAQDLLKRELLDTRIVEHILQYPDRKEETEGGEKVRFIGSSNGTTIHVIAKFLTKENKWLVITVELREAIKPSLPPRDEVPKVKFTNHALERMKLRDILPDEVESVIFYPEKTYEDDDDKVKFISKELDATKRTIHVVAKFLPDVNTWLVVTTYVRGEEDDGSLSKWKPSKKRSNSYSSSYRSKPSYPEYSLRSRPVAQPKSSTETGCMGTLIILLIIILISVLIFTIGRYQGLF